MGLERGHVRLVEHRETWADSFEREAQRLRAALGARVECIAHVGSTAVDGLCAKPIVDVLVAVDARGDADQWSDCLGPLGYEYRPNDGVPDRFFFAKGPRDDRTHYVSVTELGSETYREQLAFRDYLCAHPAVRRRYGRVKRELAARHSNDRARYTAAKSGFVEHILADALDGAGDD